MYRLHASCNRAPQDEQSRNWDSAASARQCPGVSPLNASAARQAGSACHVLRGTVGTNRITVLLV
eukprot:7235398-Ditylum_brightwellii.AAC.1